MEDIDLNDDMVKLVRWRVLWTDPEDEHLLDHGEDIVSYRTAADQYGGQIMVRFFQEAQEPGTRQYANMATVVRDGIQGLTKWNRRYLKVALEVIKRLPKDEAQYERRRTEALEGIERRLRCLG